LTKKSVLIFFLLFLALCLSAQEKGTISLGILGEANANTRHGYGLAGGLFADYGITDHIAAGLKADYGTDFYDVSSLEGLAYGRYYFLDTFIPFPFFVQLGGGMIILLEKEKKVTSFLVDGSIGIRFPIKKFYTEQYLRFGWPTGFGFGIVLGYRFGAKDKALPLPPPPPAISPPPPPPPPPPPVVKEEEPIIPEVPDLVFRANNADFAGRDTDTERGLDPQTIEANNRVLDIVSSFLKAHNTYNVLIEGYANPILGTGEEEAQRLLPISRARAEFARNELVRRGVDPEKIGINGEGGLGADPENPQRNRRVRFRIYKSGTR
jgi:hypothetical protein